MIKVLVEEGDSYALEALYSNVRQYITSDQ